MLERYQEMLASAGLGRCCGLALVATVLWFGMNRLGEAIGGSADPLPGSLADLPGWLLIWLTGSVYGVLVLLRYFATPLGIWIVIVAGALSYWLGVQVATQFDTIGFWAVNVGLAGGVSASFIAYVCVRWGSVAVTPRLFGTNAFAGVLGGAVIGLSFDLDVDALFTAGHCVWQLMTCVALYVAAESKPTASA